MRKLAAVLLMLGMTAFNSISYANVHVSTRSHAATLTALRPGQPPAVASVPLRTGSHQTPGRTLGGRRPGSGAESAPGTGHSFVPAAAPRPRSGSQRIRHHPPGVSTSEAPRTRELR